VVVAAAGVLRPPSAWSPVRCVYVTFNTDEEGARGAAEEVRVAGQRAEVRRRFLASEDATYATGSSFVVDGGLTLMAAERNG
jgi:hypothetical protein